MDNNNVAPEKVIINGVEYDPSDAQSLIDLGSKTRDFEKQYNTDLSKVYPDYTRATQEAAQYKRDLEARDQRLKEFETKAKQAETPTERKQALEAAREIGLADRDYLTEKYVSKDDLDKYWQTKSQEQRDTQTILDTGKQLEREIDGTDGRVKYNAKAVLAYASNYNFFDGKRSYETALKDAYNEMTEDWNKEWRQKQIDAAKKPGLTTLKTQGLKTSPVEKKITSEDDFKEALRESLWGVEQ